MRAIRLFALPLTLVALATLVLTVGGGRADRPGLDPFETGVSA